VLAGVLGGRPEEEAEEEAIQMRVGSAWENFEPVPGKLKVHPEALYFPEACTHFFEGNEAVLRPVIHVAMSGGFPVP
jgi:hypothetical protein